MQPEALNLFDLDGTLIKVNSFKEITRKCSSSLFTRFQIRPVLALAAWFALRKLNIISHLRFKRYVVNIFEKSLTEKEKRTISQNVFDNNVNEAVLDKLLKSDNSIVCTASPFAYVSRMSFGKNVIIISSLDPNHIFPDPANLGAGKIQNLKAYFSGQNVRVLNFHTDSDEDQPLIDFSINAFLCREGHLVRIK
jgi:hypothetical protein